MRIAYRGRRRSDWVTSMAVSINSPRELDSVVVCWYAYFANYWACEPARSIFDPRGLLRRYVELIINEENWLLPCNPRRARKTKLVACKSRALGSLMPKKRNPFCSIAPHESTKAPCKKRRKINFADIPQKNEVKINPTSQNEAASSNTNSTPPMGAPNAAPNPIMCGEYRRAIN